MAAAWARQTLSACPLVFSSCSEEGSGASSPPISKSRVLLRLPPGCTLPSPPSAFPRHLGGPERSLGRGQRCRRWPHEFCSLTRAAPSISRTMLLICHVQVHSVKNTYFCHLDFFFEAWLKGLMILGWIVLPLIAVSCLPELIRLMSCWIRGKKIPWTDQHMLLDLYANHHEHEINAKETLQECLGLIGKTKRINKLQHGLLHPTEGLPAMQSVGLLW